MFPLYLILGCGDLQVVPGNPSMYMQMVHGNAVPMNCAAGLEFSTTACVCSWPEDGSHTAPVGKG